jgi:hypothetical protein
MQRVLLALSIALVALLVLVVPGHGAADPVGDEGTFAAQCPFSHRSTDDPIVFPGAPGRAHMHDFFGNSRTDAHTTSEKIRGELSTCNRDRDRGTQDRSAYWIPTLYADGQTVVPEDFAVYYKAQFRHYRRIEPFPDHLRMIAGSATGQPVIPYRGERVIFWRRYNDARLDLHIRFPDCWNGRDLDSANHQSHMAYSFQARLGAPDRVCPPSHPRVMPFLELIARYPVRPGQELRLSSGGLETAHADFMNGWDRKLQAHLVRVCLNADRYCGGGTEPVHAKPRPRPCARRHRAARRRCLRRKGVPRRAGRVNRRTGGRRTGGRRAAVRVPLSR